MNLCTLAALVACLPGASPAPMDILIRNVSIHDGTGNQPTRGDIALAGERVVAVGAVIPVGRPRVIDGSGLVAAPGFIDLHTHCDIGEHPLTSVVGRGNRCYIWQAVTTVVTGNCGSGPIDVAAYFAKLEHDGVGTNVIHLAPHNDARSQVMGNANRAPTADELVRLEALVDRMMADGAWGLSTGLIYTPGSYARTDELVALAKVAARHRGFYASHIRDEGAGLLVALEEALHVGREAGVPVHISHIKCSGRTAWGKSADAVALIEAARRAGQIVTADQYPYVASSTSLAAIVVPPRFREGTAAEYRVRLGDPERAPQIRKSVEAALGPEKGDAIHVARYPAKPAWQGKSIRAIAESAGKDPADIVFEIERNGGAGVVHFAMKEDDVRFFMRQSFVATASDGSSHVPGPSVAHPRSYGTFPRKIGRYAIADDVIRLRQAIRSATGLPSDILGLRDRGYLKPGAYADVVVFDPEKFRDAATFAEPHQYAAGVRYLFINGKTVIDDGKLLNVLAGRPLRHPGK